MIYNNLGMVLTRLHEGTANDDSGSEGDENEGDQAKNNQFMMKSLQKKKPKNANRNKALEQAKEKFASAFELDPTYIKPLYQRMNVLREEEEYEEALADAKKIEELDPCFNGIG